MNQLSKDIFVDIVNFLDINSFLIFSQINHKFHDLKLACPFPWELSFYKQLGISLGISISMDIEHESKWKQSFDKQKKLFERLQVLPSPGCRYQKYLRWLEGVDACSSVVKTVIFATSLLPSDINDCFAKIGSQIIFSQKARYALAIMFDHKQAIYSELDRKNDRNLLNNKKSISFSEAEWKAFDVDINRYFAMFNWVTSDIRKLKQLMAEFYQIQCRGAKEFITGSLCSRDIEIKTFIQTMFQLSRQLGAFHQIQLLSNKDCLNEVSYWAHVGHV